ncbi:MAG: hypothetical protein ACREI9_04160 [Nitrospiraceae bacterium]
MGIPRKEGMVDVDVEIDNATFTVDLELNKDEVAVGGVTAAGPRLLMKVTDDGTGKGILNVTVVGGVAGTVVFSDPDTAVGIGATVPLPAIPAGTRTMIVQNTGPAGTYVRVREVGGAVGSGVLLGRFSSKEYGGPAGALDALEVEDVSLAVGGIAVATTIATQYQEN